MGDNKAFRAYQQGLTIPDPLLGAEAFGRAPGSSFTAAGEAMTYQDKARFHVFYYVKNHLDKTDEKHSTFSEDEVFVVWFSKTLKNWKALVSTTLPDGMYYEVTYDGEKKQTYLDAYKKFENVCIPDEGE